MSLTTHMEEQFRLLYPNTRISVVVMFKVKVEDATRLHVEIMLHKDVIHLYGRRIEDFWLFESRDPFEDPRKPSIHIPHPEQYLLG